MKILLVRPAPSPETIGLQHIMIVEPLELEVLHTLIRKQDSSVLVDMILEKRPFDYYVKLHKPDVLCVTGYITNVDTIIAYCRTAKDHDPKIATVAGGVHCEVCPEDLKDDAVDFRVVRNAVKTFPALLDHIENKGALPAGILSREQELREEQLPEFDFEVPIPDRSITKKYRKNYFYIFHDKVALLKTSFGCPYQCSFCFCRQITGDRYRQRPLEEVIEELESIEEKEVYIVDDDFLTDAKRIAAFANAVDRRGIRKNYLVYGRADFISENPELMEELRKIGLKTVIVGLESFVEAELAQYNKKIDASHNDNAMRILQRLNIDCFATIIMSPDWGIDDFHKLKVKLKELKIHYVNLQPLTPLPGTGMNVPGWRMLIERKEYPKWDLAHVTIKPTKMSVAEFYIQIVKLYNAILFQPGVLLNYLWKYRPGMLWKMISGSYRVKLQYVRKIKEAKKSA